MTVAARLNSRITQLAVGRHLTPRTVRARLTLMYGALFLLSGAALMAIAYALLVNAGFVFTLQNGSGSDLVRGRPTNVTVRELAVAPQRTSIGFAGSNERASAETMAHWRGVAQCMRQHGLSGFPDPRTSIPSSIRGGGVLADRDGAIFAIPVTITAKSAFTRATTLCGFSPDHTRATAATNRQRSHTEQQLLIQSGIALAGMSLLSLVLGWLMAGRVLQPLEDSHEAQRQFVANASHELRAPLTRQRALIEVAVADPDASAASLQATHERVLASEQHLEQLIDGLLALTRGQAGLERREHLDLASLTTKAMLARESQLAELDVRERLAPAPTAGDPRLLERLIANLIDNSIRHNVPGGHVEITTGNRHQRAFLMVTNSGPTIPPEEVARLLEPFQRLTARTYHNNGHGLGLSIVRAIANAHRAELSARARPDGGLIVEVSFPPATPPGSRLTFATAWAKRAVSNTDAPAQG